jgi:uncharacterized alpha/beta hydrolase family protein
MYAHVSKYKNNKIKFKKIVMFKLKQHYNFSKIKNIAYSWPTLVHDQSREIVRDNPDFDK